LKLCIVGGRDKQILPLVTLDTLDEGCFPLPYVIMKEMYLFLSIIVQMSDDERDRLKDY
jgi:hypothetical protein